MAVPYVVQHTRAIPVDVGTAFTRTIDIPLPSLFRRRYAFIPSIRTVRDQDGEWGTAGQSRTIVLADRGTMHEVLTAVEPPHRFAYELTGITGILATMTSRVQGEWRFEPVGTGTAVTWWWSIDPLKGGGAALPLVARMWRGYARQALEQLEGHLLR